VRAFGNVKEARTVNWDDFERHAPSGSWIAKDLRPGQPHYRP